MLRGPEGFSKASQDVGKEYMDHKHPQKPRNGKMHKTEQI